MCLTTNTFAVRIQSGIPTLKLFWDRRAPSQFVRHENPGPQLGYTVLNLGIPAQRGDSPVTGICPMAVSLAIHSSCHGILPILTESIFQLKEKLYIENQVRGTMASVPPPLPKARFPTKHLQYEPCQTSEDTLPATLAGSRGVRVAHVAGTAYLEQVGRGGRHSDCLRRWRWRRTRGHSAAPSAGTALRAAAGSGGRCHSALCRRRTRRLRAAHKSGSSRSRALAPAPCTRARWAEARTGPAHARRTVRSAPRGPRPPRPRRPEPSAVHGAE